VKASCTDPKTGKIDASILTTGVSSTDRKKRTEIGRAIIKLLESKHKTAAVSKQKLLMEMKAQSLLVNKEKN